MTAISTNGAWSRRALEQKRLKERLRGAAGRAELTPGQVGLVPLTAAASTTA